MQQPTEPDHGALRDCQNPLNVLAQRREHITHDHTGDTLKHVHVTENAVASFELTPPHAPREETAEYRKSHRSLVHDQDKPCRVCGVKQSTLHDPKVNRYGASAMETHHYPIERSLMNACDPSKVHERYPQVHDQASLEAFVDSTFNLIVLCDIHHRSLEQGIHHLLCQDFAVLPFLKDHYQIAASAKDCHAAQASDEALFAEKDHAEKDQ